MELDTPKFKMIELKGFVNPFTKEGVRALAIVLGVIVVISGIVYAANFGKRKESAVLSAETSQEVTATPSPTVPTETPTIMPLTEEEELLASPSPTRKVLKPTGTPTPTVEE